MVIAALILLVFIGTFVFLWRKSQPQPIEYEEFYVDEDAMQEMMIELFCRPVDEKE